jgi:hypothetical protein
VTHVSHGATRLAGQTGTTYTAFIGVIDMFLYDVMSNTKTRDHEIR